MLVVEGCIICMALSIRLRTTPSASGMDRDIRMAFEEAQRSRWHGRRIAA